MTLGAAAAAPSDRRGLWLLLGLLAVVVVGGGAGWVYFVRQRGPSARSAPSTEASAAQARVHELEAKIARLERERAEAETRAAEEARRTVEAQAASRGKAVDPAAVQRAQDEARQRARIEQEQKQQEELRRLAEERTAEVRRLAAEATPMPVQAPASIPTPTPDPVPVATPTPATDTAPMPVPVATPTPAPEANAALGGPTPSAPGSSPEQPGNRPAGGAPATPPPAVGRAVADASDPAVKPPVMVSEEKVPYPSRAVVRRISTSVVVRALVDEQGRVSQAAVVQPSGQPPEFGFDEAALKRVRSRTYRPARRNGVPVPIWVLVRVDFRPPRPQL
jgi:protein TonB